MERAEWLKQMPEKVEELSLELVRKYVWHTGMAIIEEGRGNGYLHFLVKRRQQ